MLIPLLAALFAVVSYRGTVHVARDHGLLVSSIFDLYRFDLLTAMRYQLPNTTEAEYDLNSRLSVLLSSTEKASVILPGRVYEHLTQPTENSVRPKDQPSGGGESRRRTTRLEMSQSLRTMTLPPRTARFKTRWAGRRSFGSTATGGSMVPSKEVRLPALIRPAKTSQPTGTQSSILLSSADM